MRNNSHTIHSFKVHSSVVFRLVRYLCKHSDNPILGHFPHTKKKTVRAWAVTPYWSPTISSSPENHRSPSQLYALASSGTFHINVWTLHPKCGLLWPASFTPSNDFIFFLFFLTCLDPLIQLHLPVDVCESDWTMKWPNGARTGTGMARQHSPSHGPSKNPKPGARSPATRQHRPSRSDHGLSVGASWGRPRGVWARAARRVRARPSWGHCVFTSVNSFLLKG